MVHIGFTLNFLPKTRILLGWPKTQLILDFLSIIFHKFEKIQARRSGKRTGSEQ